jgi:tetratricopeptide (TPR) repeat protein
MWRKIIQKLRPTDRLSTFVRGIVIAVLSGLLLWWLKELNGFIAIRRLAGLAWIWMSDPGTWRFLGLGMLLALSLAFIMFITRRSDRCRTEIKCDIFRLSWSSRTGNLRGRGTLIKEMRTALASPSVAVFALTGLGGIGKTAVARAFVEELVACERTCPFAFIARLFNSGRRVRRIFAWSFETERPGPGELDTLGQFWNATLRFWDFKDDLNGMEAAEKARHLAQCLKAVPSLLILDNVEALQRSNGALKDLALVAFLDCLRLEGIGKDSIVVVISRRAVDGLRDGGSMRTLYSVNGDALRLSPAAGAQVLRDQGVCGSDAALEAASRQLDGHPLTLTLAGAALARHFGGAVMRLQELLDQFVDQDPVTSLFEYYVRTWPPDSAHLPLLQFASLFGRPVHHDEIVSFIRCVLPSREFERLSPKIEDALCNLVDIGLVIVNDKMYDIHALAAAYFSTKFASQDIIHFRKGHAILFHDALNRSPSKAETVEDLVWLYRAVYHACRAGLYKQAFNRVYLTRISDGMRFFNASVLGDRPGDMGSIACFFPLGIATPSNPHLAAPQRWWLVARAAFNLSALGRFEESIAPRRAGIAIVKDLKAWGLAADDSRRLFHTLVELGRLQEAKMVIEEAVVFSEKFIAEPRANSVVNFISGKDPETLKHRCIADREYVAVLMGNTGDINRIWEAYGSAEEKVIYHRSLLALAAQQSDLERVRALAEISLAKGRQSGKKNAIANDAIVLGQVLRHLGDLDQAELLIDEARTFMSDAGRVDGLMRALIEKAAIHEARWRHHHDSNLLAHVSEILDELEQLVAFSGAQLLSVDGELMRVSVLNDIGRKEEARTRLEVLMRTIAEMGYHLRNKDLVRLQAEVDQ